MPPNRDLEGQTLRRISTVVRIALLWVLVIFCRLVHLQVINHAEYLRQARLQQEKEIEIQAPRGAILDRNLRPLAMSVPVDSVCVNPLRVPDLEFSAEILARTLDQDASTLYIKMKVAQDSHRGFVWIKRRIAPDESEKLKSYGFDWIEYRQESRRFYPNGQLAAHVVGGVNFEEKGNGGIELTQNDDLEGLPGRIRMITDVKQRAFDAKIFTETQPGRNLVLTLDERLQFLAERALAYAVVSNNCKTGSLVAMEPKTGEILALANYPTFDPNQPLQPDESLADRNNLAVSVPFEPGSVFKVITLTAALETTNLRPATIIPCGSGVLRLAGRVIHDHNSYSALSMADVLAKSSNIGAINIGLRVGPEHLHEYVKRFGFGQETGLPLPGESTGVVRPLTQWQATSIGSVAMGHEISTTAVQLAQACSVIANGGLLVRPKLVKARQRPGQPLEPEPGAEPRRILQADTVMTMRTMMEGVVLHGTGRSAKLDHYTSAGKTGTAQIFDTQTHQYTHRYNASYMGFAPVTDPAVVVVVTLNGAAKYGGEVATPVFREVTNAALRFLGVRQDLPDSLAVEEQGDVPADEPAIADLSAPALVPVETAASQPGVSLQPFAAPIGPALPPQSPAITGPQVPDFHGKTLRAVLEESTRSGVPVEFTGNGIARSQSPAAGVILPPGERVRVEFAR